jgi:hypothetical protein
MTPSPQQNADSSNVPQRQPLGPHVRFLPVEGGGARVELLPARNRLAGLFASVLALSFAGFGVALQVFTPDKAADAAAKAWFSAAACGIGVMTLLVGLRLLLLKTTVTVGDGKILIENSVGVASRRREIQSADILDITVKLQGSVQNTLIYSINAVGVAVYSVAFFLSVLAAKSARRRIREKRSY